MIVDAEVVVRSHPWRPDEQRRGLAAALVAAGRLPGLERAQESVAELRARIPGEGRRHRVENFPPGQKIAGDAEAVLDAMAAPRLAVGARVSPALVVIDAVDLTLLAKRIIAEERGQRLTHRPARGESSQSVA